MKPEIESIPNEFPDAQDSITSLDLLEPQTELGAKLIALAKEIDKSGIQKLTFEEMEEYLGRELGCIAEASRSSRFVDSQI